MNVHSRSRSIDPPSRAIIGTEVAVLAWNEALDLLRGFLAEKRFTKISFLNAHNANVASTDAAFAQALDDFLILPDGVGVDVASKLLYGEKFPANLNGTDFIPALLVAETRPLTIGLLGATRINAQRAAAKLSEIAPRHRFEVVHDGFFSAAEETEILDRLRRMKPDILLVAMGVPRQELWIARNLDQSFCTLPIAVGALLDFLSGAVPRAPRLVRKLRLEWLFRLAIEPGRLWRRYVLGNPVFLTRVLAQKLGAMRGIERDDRA